MKEIIGDCTLYLGDCLEVMADMPAESIDMIWTDPPYGHSNHDGDLNSQLNKHRGIDDKPIANDDADGMRVVVDGMLVEAARVLNSDCCCCCCCGGGGGPRPTFAWVANRMDSKGFDFFHSVIWDKNNPGLGWRYRRQHEMVMVAHKSGGKLLWNEAAKAAPNVFRLMPPRERQHPNEKPVALVEAFLGWHTTKSAVVLDPFMGSGTTGVACVNLGRSFIGVELSQEYFDTACRRIEDAHKQPRLFDESAPAPEQETLI